MGKNHKNLLNNLEELRKSAGLTQQELSESAEVSRKSINAIEQIASKTQQELAYSQVYNPIMVAYLGLNNCKEA